MFFTDIYDATLTNRELNIKPCTIYQGPVLENRNNSIPGINVPYFRDNFIHGINSVPERRNNAIDPFTAKGSPFDE